MHSFPLIVNITLALVVAFFGGAVARRLGLPTIVGYLLAGIAIGPFTPGYVGDISTIQQLAELGVIFLMFGVGLHFSFADLLRVRDIAIPGALIQTLLATLIGFGLTQLWGWPVPAGIVLGLSISVASTVVLLRGLMDNLLLNTTHGQAAVGWLVMEDILSVLILVLMPALSAESSGFDIGAITLTLVKAAGFVAVMFLAGARLIPSLLERIARTRSRELFILATLAITLGTALGAAELFGVSLALGAFVAGAIINQSPWSHQVDADMFTFREAFSVLFFVSVGMLVNPAFLWSNLGQVAALTLLVVVGKLLIVIFLGLLFPRPARTFLVIAVGLSQIGEFSFILGQAGVYLGLLAPDQYSLILAASLISITINPFMYRLLPKLETSLQRMPGFWKQLEANRPLAELDERQLQDHVVIVGYGRIGKHLVNVLRTLGVPQLAIESDAERVRALNEAGIATLYGDAANSEVIMYAHLSQARALLVTTPDETAAAMIVASARKLNPDLPIIARAATAEGVRQLAHLGATDVVHPELEGGLEMVHDTLLRLGYPLREVHQYAEAVRRDAYDFEVMTSDEHRSLREMLLAAGSIEIQWVRLDDGNPLVGRTLLESNIRAHTGASVVALIRDGRVMANPKSSTEFVAGDRIGLIGDPEQLETALGWLAGNLEVEPSSVPQISPAAPAAAPGS
jgi:monovalent cation:H+ antiporter-2, CPA2 family